LAIHKGARKPTSALAAGDLLDVNVWLALLNEQHPHHTTAKNYWDHGGEGDAGPAQRILFCRVTMLGVLRLSTNKVVMGGSPYTVDQAWAAWRAVAQLPEVAQAAEPTGTDTEFEALSRTPKFKTTDWTDTYLAAFAIRAGARLVTFDKGFSKYAGLTLLTL
jgi:uncharacterized protein